jgi:hypothetical protein
LLRQQNVQQRREPVLEEAVVLIRDLKRKVGNGSLSGFASGGWAVCNGKEGAERVSVDVHA